jgi:hypothetical protein
MKLTRRMDKIELLASPQIKNAIEELQLQKDAKTLRAYKAYRWRCFSAWLYQNPNPIAEKAYAAYATLPEEPEDETLECNGGEISCEECGGCQMPVWDEDVDIDKLSTEHRANWIEYLELFFSIPDDVLWRAENIWMADILGTTPDDPELDEKIAAIATMGGNDGN